MISRMYRETAILRLSARSLTHLCIAGGSVNVIWYITRFITLYSAVQCNLLQCMFKMQKGPKNVRRSRRVVLRGIAKIPAPIPPQKPS